MKSSLFWVLLRVCILCTTGLFSVCSVNAAGFSSFYSGSPDFSLVRVEQSTSKIIYTEVCNQSSVSIDDAQIRFVVRSGSRAIQERYFSDVPFAGGECRAFRLEDISGISAPRLRTTSFEVRLEVESDPTELRTTNNALRVAAKQSQASRTTRMQNTDDFLSGSEFETAQEDSSAWIYTQTTRYSPSGNSVPYSASSYSTRNNGDFNPANPTWLMQKNKQVMYIYTAPGQGQWYSYAPVGNQNYLYVPMPGETNSASYFDSTYPALTTMNGQYYTESPSNAFSVQYSQGFALPQTSYSNSTPPTSTPAGCTNWQYNSATGRYEWYCNQGVWWGYGIPDIYLKNLRQNGTKNELVATICNQGDSMQYSASSQVRISNGLSQNSAKADVQFQLNSSGCVDAYIPLQELRMMSYPATYVFFVELDSNQSVRESREDNNSTYWRLAIN